MPEIKVLNMAGEEVGKMTLSDLVFAADINSAVLHAAVKRYLGNQRQGTQSTLTRTEVSGGGRKPWKQKGTGRARQGSTRAPQWTHGGIALGPKPRSYRVSINKKVKQIALFSVLSSKVASNELIVVDNIALDSYKTKNMVAFLKAVGAEGKAMIVTSEVNEFVVGSANNIEGVITAPVNTINVYDILNHDKFIISKDALTKLEEVYA